MIKKLLIMVGPQGAGNHLFSKVFAASDEIGGWKNLLSTYWSGHHTEPFNEVWAGSRPLQMSDFDGFTYWVTSISIPYVNAGELCCPDVLAFKDQAEALGVETVIGVISRDINILEYQQTRVRGEITLPVFIEQFRRFSKVVYLSHESLCLYGQTYLDHICDEMGFPNCPVPEMTNSNKKYISYVKQHELDIEVHRATEHSKQNRNTIFDGK